MSDKILTVIVPSYNMEKYLPKCLGSLVVAPELMEKLEVIVVNDGSKDRTSEIAHEFEAKYPQTFRVIDKANGHYGSCINAALPVAKGAFVKILDADDYVEHEAWVVLLRVIGFETEHLERKVDLVIANFSKVDENGNFVPCPWADDSYQGLSSKELFTLDEVPIDNPGFFLHSIVYRKSIFEKFNYQQVEGVSYTDSQWVREPMAFVCNCRYIPDVVTRYLVGRDGQTMTPETYAKNYWMHGEILVALAQNYERLMNLAVPSSRAYYDREVKRYISNFYFGYCFGARGCLPRAFHIGDVDNRLSMVSKRLFDYSGSVFAKNRLMSFYIVKAMRRWHSRYAPSIICLKMMSKAMTLARWVKRVCRSVLKQSTSKVARKFLSYDSKLFAEHSGSFKQESLEAKRAAVCMAYHVIEKGLTMPNKRLDFGHESLYNLMRLVDDYEKCFGRGTSIVDYAAGVVKEYLAFHERSNFPINSEDAFWKRVMNFCKSHADIPCSKQVSTTREMFFKDINASFPVFAASRHTCRHYEGPLPLETIESAVKLAMTAPSACNRQHARVHCVSNHQTRDVIFTLQNGNRGFAKDADKLLVVTSDLNDLRWHEERNDIYTNAGMFLMNLCYALHYHKVAHCVLNWSVSPEADRKLHDLLGIGMNERPVALVCCGPMPERVELAASPRKKFEDIFTNHE